MLCVLGECVLVIVGNPVRAEYRYVTIILFVDGYYLNHYKYNNNS